MQTIVDPDFRSGYLLYDIKMATLLNPGTLAPSPYWMVHVEIKDKINRCLGYAVQKKNTLLEVLS